MKDHCNNIDNFNNADNNISTSKLQFILKNIDAAVILESADNKIEYLNNAYCKLFNIAIPSDDLIGICSIETIKATAYLFSEPENYIERLLETKEIGILISKEELLLIDGRVFEFDYQPIFDNNSNKLCGHLWMFRDITTFKKLEKAHQIQHLFYQKVLSNIPADISIYDKQHKYLFANKSGFKEDVIREWIIGKDDFDYSLSQNKGLDKALSRREYFEQTLNTLQTVHFEEKEINDKGQEVNNVRYYYPCLTENNEVEFVISYGVNVSKKKQNERLLINSVETYQNLIHQLDEVVFIINKNNILQYVNPLWEKVFNRTYYQSVGNPINDFFPVSVFESIEKDIENIKIDLSIDKIKGEVTFKNQEGDLKHYNYYFSRFFSAIKDEEMVSGYLIDITNQVNAKDDLRNILQKERLFSNMKTVFVNTVSHELRTPLAIIQSSAEILEMLYQHQIPAKETVLNYSGKIVDEVKNLKALMDELLLISRIETDKQKFNAVDIDIVSFVDEIISQQYNPWNDGRKLTVEVRGNKRIISGDKFMLKHIINNILDNAFKYSSGKKEPMLRLFFGHNSWSLVCRDYGIGIPENDIASLGTSFKRGSNVEFIQGTGLGLVVVNYFVEKHNGTIQFQSSIGKGTFVHISFPY